MERHNYGFQINRIPKWEDAMGGRLSERKFLIETLGTHRQRILRIAPQIN